MEIIKKKAYEILIKKRSLSANKRALPYFIIVGTQKGGTATLYNYLCQHSRITRALKKEVHYFDLNYEKGIKWYKSFFPYIKVLERNNSITGEASPFYMFLNEVPTRIKKDVPDTKLIVLLRNPTDRAISQFEFNRMKGQERRTQEEFLKEYNFSLEKIIEYEQSIKDVTKMRENSYLTRGFYVDQLDRIYDSFPENQIKIIISEEFFTNPQKTMGNLFQYLNLNTENFKSRTIANYNKGKKINSVLKELLDEFYLPQIKMLESKYKLDLSFWKDN